MNKLVINGNNKIINIDDCWNKIGVHGNGDRSCSDLKEIIHCRNCSKFISAGRRLLDRDLPIGYKKEWCNKISAISTKQNKLQSIVLFRLGNQWFGLPPKYFHEVIKWNDIHSMPHNTTDQLKGIVAIRGEIQLCISLEHILGINRGESLGDDIRDSISKRMVVLSGSDEKYVFPVSEIRDIHHYSTKELAAPPATASTNSKNVIIGVLNLGDKYITCLSFNILIDLINGIFE